MANLRKKKTGMKKNKLRNKKAWKRKTNLSKNEPRRVRKNLKEKKTWKIKKFYNFTILKRNKNLNKRNPEDLS
jgi:hypothetical protein